MSAIDPLIILTRVPPSQVPFWPRGGGHPFLCRAGQVLWDAPHRPGPPLGPREGRGDDCAGGPHLDGSAGGQLAALPGETMV